MSKTTIVLPVRTTYEKMKKEKVCDLCGKGGNIEMYCGGPFSWLHPECAELGDKAIKAYLRSMAYHPLEYLVNEIHDILKAEGQKNAVDK